MKITNCAVRISNGCIVTMGRPARHHHILNTHGDLAGEEQGFLTNEGYFVDREEAFTIARDAGQIVRRCGGDDDSLFSENLW